MYEVNATIDCKQAIDEYIGNTDWRVRANSNTTYSNAGLVNNTAGKVAAKYWLSEVYSPEEGKAHIEGDYHIHDLDCMTAYCFTGDTKVVLLDGTTPSFKELTEKYKNGEYFWVVSRDKQGNIVPGKAHHPRLIKHNAELMEITISGGAKIVCTPDHEFMLRDGSYRQAKDLRSRESLMPYYSNTKGRYIFINDSKLGIKDYLHRLVGKWKSGVQDLAGYAVHHVNGDKKDNRPENIEVLCGKEHRALELRNTMQSEVWQKANNTRLQEYNRSEEKRSSISKLAQQRNRNEKGQFYNHTVVSKKYLDYTEDVYCLTVDEHENFALEAGVFVHNCAGWNLRSLLAEGFNGVRSRVNSKPPRHLREALGQMANFLGILQSEWAGAQAFSSFDTFLAPYVFKDKISFKSLKKAIRSFVYNLNVPSRWGQCVKEEYKCLRGDGKWVTYHDLNPGDEIYVVDPATGVLKKDVLTHVNVFDAPEKMHRYYNEQGFNFEVTDNHRVIYKTGANGFSIKPSSELINRKSPIDIPISAWGDQLPSGFFGNEYDIDDELLEFITFIMCDGCIVHQEGKAARLEFYKSPNRYGCDRFEELCDILKIKYSKKTTQSSTFKTPITVYRLHNNAEVAKVIELLDADKHKTPEFVQYLSPRQCYIMLDRWVTLDGHFDGSHWKMQADTENIQEMLAFLAVRAGKSAALHQRYIGENKTATKYTTVYKRGCRSCKVKEVESSTKKVWCPTTNTGTFICMTDEGYIFVTGNSPFTNITIDWTVPEDLKEDMPLCGAEHLLYGINDSELIAKAKERGVDELHAMTYKHFQPEMNMIQKAYYEVMTEGDSTGQPFTFPIPTVNITEEFDWEGENVLTLFENAAKIGSSYFQNFVGSQYKIDENGNRVEDEEAYKPSAVRSMCCRLQLDLNELRKRGNGLFGSAESTGSVGVVTINLARLGYKFKGDKEGLYKELDRLMELAKSTLEKKRVFVTDMYNRGLYPYTKRYLPAGFRNHFSTIGVNGGNEMIRNFTNDEYDITTKWGRQFAEDLLNHIRNRMREFQNETGNLYNLEASPGEGATHRFAREDKKRFPDIIQAGCAERGQIYYTNSTQLPSWYTEDLFMALKLQDKLQTRYTGGTVFHMYMSEMISSPEACRDIVRKVLTNFKMPYITVTPLFSVCDKHGYLKGRHDFCPLCDEEILANARQES